MYLVAKLQAQVFIAFYGDAGAAKFDGDHGGIAQQFKGKQYGRKVGVCLSAQLHVFSAKT